MRRQYTGAILILTFSILILVSGCFDNTTSYILKVKLIPDDLEPAITANQKEKWTKIPNFQIRDGYTFLWKEFEDAPEDQSGDDSVVFGPSLGPFHNYTELVTKLTNLNTTYPEIIQVSTIGKTYFGREIYCVRITNESILLPKTEVLVVGQHHAQEQINVENALYFIDKLVYDYFTSSSPIQRLLNTKSIFVIPSLNIDGAALLSQNPWQRKTARPIDEDGDGVTDEYEIQDVNMDGYVDRLYDESNNFVGYEGIDLDGDGSTGNDIPGGVDPNRNYAYNFGNQPGASDDISAWNYHGPYPFSENCTARFRDFAMTRNFITAVSLHSGMDYTMLLGPGHAGVLPGGDDRDLYISTGTKLTELTGFTLEMNGGVYTTSGVWDDWMYTNDTLLAFTFETYGDPSSYGSIYNSTTGFYHHRGVWDYCNPPADAVIENSVQTYPGLLFMAEEAPYLSIETDYTQEGEKFLVHVSVSNPSTYIRTNGSIVLNWTVSHAVGITPVDSIRTVNLGEIEARSNKEIIVGFSINQPNYSLLIKFYAGGSKVGTSASEFLIDPSQETTKVNVSIPFAMLLSILVVVLIRRNAS